MLINPKFTAGKLNDFDVIERIQNLSKKQALGITAGVGGSLGVTKAAVDDEDDSLGSTLKKGVTGAAMTAGTAYGLDALMTKTKWGQDKVKELTASKVAFSADADDAHRVASREDAKERSVDREIERTKTEVQATEVAQQAEKHKDVTTGDIAKEEVKAKHEAGFDKIAKEKKMKGMLTKGKVIGQIGLGLFAVASVMDTGNSLEESKNVSRMKEEQERSLVRKQNREKQSQNQYGYGYMTGGDVISELWDNRIGHHKMGNSKFQ